ncbi:hypothetical protein AAL_04253 [Moelleriella libera RCEF 2490]|uniref:Large ribosomal subunit protein bL21m n=1 Tax=Moelleriella libera RCEF 2490 TaxID=1081109 RepID=A0A168BZS1_9HYPO|nr:hypothetical protein AAL_04253 [Moelleriella libera RCEF 2490]
MSKTILRSVLELRPSFAPLSFPRGFTKTTPIIEPSPPPPPPPPPTQQQQQQQQQLQRQIPQQHVINAPNPTVHHIRPIAFKKSHPSPPPTPIQDSVKQLLPLLMAQPGHYITVHIHGFPYLVQEGDQIRLPFRMPGVLPGDVLRLNRASVIGSRDYTMKGAPHIDERVFECRATVLGVESEPLRIKIKKKRRCRRKRQAKSKHRYTILRISELSLKDVGC